MIYDIIVIGGGALGTWVARDAALRGLSVALFEQEDFGAGATSRLPRLLPAGLRSLETLDFTQVRGELREREILLQIAPHLVHPQPCLVPFYGHGLLAQTRLRAGLALNDALGFDKSLPLHQVLTASAALSQEPSLRPDGLAGAALVWEAYIPLPERLALENALDARSHGASLHTHTRVDGLRRLRASQGQERAGGVRWTDRLTGETGETASLLVVNAAGAWLPDIDDALPALKNVYGMRRKCVTIALPPLRGHRSALVFLREEEGRLLFVVPWQDWAWAGSLELLSEESLDAPATLYPTKAEVAALLGQVGEFLPEAAASSPALALAGMRVSPPFPGPPALPDSFLPFLRDHALAADSGGAQGGRMEGLISAAGGSLISCRSQAEEVVDLACRKLGRALSTPPCRTAAVPLPSGQSGGAFHTVGDETARKVAVERAVREEECRTLQDFLLRRSLLFWTPDQGRAAVPAVLETMSALLGWDAPRQAQEVKAWEAEVALTQAFRIM